MDTMLIDIMNANFVKEDGTTDFGMFIIFGYLSARVCNLTPETANTPPLSFHLEAFLHSYDSISISQKYQVARLLLSLRKMTSTTCADFEIARVSNTRSLSPFS
jgi:hypothetical protein